MTKKASKFGITCIAMNNREWGNNALGFPWSSAA